MTGFLLPLLVPLASALAAPPAPDLIEVHLPAQAQGVRLVVAPPPEAGADAQPYVVELRVQPWSVREAPALSVEPLAEPPVFLAPESVSLASAAPATAAMATQPLDAPVLDAPVVSALPEDAFLVTHAASPPPETPAPPPALVVQPELRAAGAAFEMACESGHARACVELAGMVTDGSLGEPDPARAKELYSRACENGDVDSCEALSPLPEAEPTGSAAPPVPPAPVAPALALDQRLGEACDQGDYAACTELGGRATHGDGVPKDPVMAARLFQRACAGGAMGACTDLGILYEVGEGVSQDETRAERLFQLACNGGAGDQRACGLLEE